MGSNHNQATFDPDVMYLNAPPEANLALIDYKTWYLGLARLPQDKVAPADAHRILESLTFGEASMEAPADLKPGQIYRLNDILS